MSKKWVLIFVVLVSLVAVASNVVFSEKEKIAQEKTQATTYYTCPMHPQVNQDHPGDCPICHMKLVKVEKEKQENTNNHENHSVSIDASLKQKDQAQQDDHTNYDPQVANMIYYTCPMHPQVNQDHPGDCPICHMKLVQVKKSKSQDNLSGGGSEKRSSIHANDHQLELIGIQKIEAEKMDLQVRIPISGRAISPSRLAFQIYESDLKDIRVGLKFTGEENVSSEKISGIIISIDSIVDPSSRTVRVVGAIEKGPKNLLSETSFRGEIHIDLKDRLTIPESAILHTGDGPLVYVVDKENKLTPTRIRIGAKSLGFYEVLSGLNEGDKISSGPNFLIDSEAKIRGAND